VKAPCAALCLALALAACARTSQVKSEASVHETTQETVQTGPETITTTVEEYAAPEEVAGRSVTPGSVAVLPSGEPSASLSEAPRQTPQPHASLPPHGPLVKRTVTVDERGPVTATRGSVTDLHGYEDSESSSTPQLPAVKCGFGGSVWAVVALLLLLLAGVVALKLLRKWPFG
jgi:hypothetical protein